MTELHAITPHAVIRFIERVLSLELSPEIWRAHDGGERMTAAKMACQSHGFTIEQIRRMMADTVPMIDEVIRAGAPDIKITNGKFTYVFRQGLLVTVVFKWMRDESRGELFRKPERKRESRREAHKLIRRHRKRSKADDRARRLPEDA